MNEIEKVSQDIYGEIRQSIIHVQYKVQQAVNTGMVQIYWEIGQQLDKACDGKQAEYGKGVLQHVSEKLTAEFGKVYSVRNLQMMRQFYLAFPNANTLCSHLSWSHYRLLMRVNNIEARTYYEKECAASRWSVRELERQISTLAYQRTLSIQEETKNLVSEIKRRSSKEELKVIGKLDKNNLTFVLPEEYGKNYSLNVLVDGKLYDATLLSLDSKYYYAIKYSANKFFKNKKELKVILTGKDNEQITLEYVCNYYSSGEVKLLKNAFALLSTQKDLELDISNISQINLGEFLTNLKILNKDKLYKKSTDDVKIKYLTEKYERASKSFVTPPYKYKNNILFPSNSYIFEYGLEYILDNAKRYGISKYGDLEAVQDVAPSGTDSLEETYKNALLGDSDAEYNLGMIYLNGEGIAIDFTEAIKWFKLSSAQNNMKADYQLALCLEKGIGISKDKNLAMYYYQKAADAGHRKAKEKVSK